LFVLDSVLVMPFFESTSTMSALASSSASVNRPHFDSSSSAAFSTCAPPASLRIKMVFARNASAGTPCANTAGEAESRQLAASSSAEQRKRGADMMAPWRKCSPL
jgi:hypothetical protein